MHSDRRRLKSIALIVGITTAVIMLLHLFYFDPLRKAEYYVRDLLAVAGRKAPVDPRLFFLAIDKPSVHPLDSLFPGEITASQELTLMGKGWPWTREVYALVQERLMRAGAKAVIFDLLFPQSAPGDALFREKIDRYRNQVVLACDFVFSRIGAAMRAGVDMPAASLIEPTQPVDQRIGFDTLWPDPDGVLRRVPLATTLRELEGFSPTPYDEHYESLAARTVRQIGEPELLSDGEPRVFRYAGGPGTFPVHSIYEMFVPKLWHSNYQDGAVFKDKIVMVGPEGSWSHDEHPTPFRLQPGPRGLMAGPEIHLQALNAVLQREYIRELKPWQELLLFLAAGVLAFGVSLMASAWSRIIVVVLAVAGYAVVAMLLFNHPGVFVPVVAPALIAVIATIGNEISDYRRERQDKARLRSTLGQYVGEPVVERLMADPSTYVNALGGVRKPVTVLFADLRNFTGLTIGRDPAELVEQLNEYFSHMTAYVMDSKGMVDKLMGDSLMAVWGTLHTDGPKADGIAAVRAALAMANSLKSLNGLWREKGWPEFRFGIGIAHGEALVGNVGCARKMDFTAIGDVTNVASKIQDLTTELDCELVISDSLAALVKDEFELAAAGPVALKGRPFALNIFIVLADKKTAGRLAAV
ncbi:MAG: adenylate/guanylate cyclase domain-containing protein [Verrucomicrobiota bacterium]|nr:adenylate/guanylate cyclase domain-containing protein [Verrucomicrobiota bacterium]